VQENVRRRGIATRLNAPVKRLWHENGEIKGVIVGNERIPARRGVVLCCGGFEASAELQRQHWSTPPVLSAASLFNTGDGIRMAQELGAGLWHMWHFHGAYGFRLPAPDYPFGIRIRRLRNWVTGIQPRQDTKASWIIVDQRGRRFMNEYEPYMHDTNHRAMHLYDPATRTYPRIPAILVVDAAGRRFQSLAEPTWHDAATSAKYGTWTPQQFDEKILVTKGSLAEIAGTFKLDPAIFAESIARWNAACAAGADQDFGRLPGSMMPIVEPPFSAAHVWPIVSNTQGGLPHDEEQRVLNSFDEAIPRLYVAGELGSIFGHLYIAGGNLAECFIGGRIAGSNAARLEPWEERTAA
jgi:succinate dehydrogenase/fumarate reductase flavoprotein subunit